MSLSEQDISGWGKIYTFHYCGQEISQECLHNLYLSTSKPVHLFTYFLTIHVYVAVASLAMQE